MNKSKAARLRKAGWRVSDAREFLDLSDEELGLIDLKLGFAEFLREQRRKRRLTQAQLAKLLGSSQSRVAKMEAGDASVSLDLMFRTAFGLGASARELGLRITAIRRRTRASRRAG
jgi:DNA-binding XRE family transcriptional regulator